MDTHTGKRDHARREVEVGVVQPQAKECLESLGSWKQQERFSPRTFGGIRGTLGFWASGLQRERTFLMF